MLEDLKRRWSRLVSETHAVYLAARHPQTPWYASAMALCVVAYALSPIDLIPDFVPVLGLLDDLVLVPLGIALVVRMIPQAVLEESRLRVEASASRPVLERRLRTFAVLGIVAVWVLATILVLGVSYSMLARSG